MSKQYKKVAVGGTFDRLHKGHEELLLTAFSKGDKVIIGITDQSMVKEKAFSQTITPYIERKREVELFLKKHKLAKRAHIVMLRDPLGPLRTDKEIEAVVIGPRVDEKTINTIKKSVDIVRCTTIVSKDNSYLSSTRIRQGEINRNGAVFSVPDHDLILPNDIRAKLKKPLGDMVFDTTALETRYAPLIISVGDATTKRLVDDDIYIDLAIIDLFTNRAPSPHSLSDLGISEQSHVIVNTINNAGTISHELFCAVHESLCSLSESRAKPHAIVIQGEEDLATLPALFCAPLTSFVWYGQPKIHPDHPEGLVGIEVTERTKRDTAKLLSKFDRRVIK